MAYPTSNWLLDPTIPALPALPRLDPDTLALAEGDDLGHGEQHSAQPPSGTWRLGARLESELEDCDPSSGRFATSDSEAPTVRPGSLGALLVG